LWERLPNDDAPFRDVAGFGHFGLGGVALSIGKVRCRDFARVAAGRRPSDPIINKGARAVKMGAEAEQFEHGAAYHSPPPHVATGDQPYFVCRCRYEQL